MSESAILITGASGGLGTAIAAELATSSREFVLAARSTGALEETKSIVEENGATATIHSIDVQNEDEITAMLEEASVDTLDLVIPAAAIASPTSGNVPLPDESYNDFQTVWRTNVYGVFATVKESLPYLSESSRVLVPSGTVARKPTEGVGAYGVSKAAAEGLARNFSADISATVGIVDPGLVATEITGGKGRDPEDVAAMFEWAAFECETETLDGSIVGLREWKQAIR